MSATTLGLCVLAALATGALFTIAIITIAGRQSEESPAARRAALGRAASRARAQSPAPLQLPWTPRRRWFGRRVKPGGPMIRISGSWGILEAPAEAMHWDRLFGVTIKRPAYTDLVRSMRMTPSKSIESSGRRRVVEAIAGIPVVLDKSIEPGTCELRVGERTVASIHGLMWDETYGSEYAEQELARRRAQSGGEAA